MVRGTIAVEEAIIDPNGISTLAQHQALLSPSKDVSKTLSLHEARLLDIHGKRLASMDEHGVEYMLLSLTSPGAQGEPSPQAAEELATVANNYLSAEAAKNPTRFGALAALSMHDPQQAATELTRCVKELGMFGGLVNDFQSTGEDGTGKEYFDTAKYDVFWETVQKLDVPIYFHPRYRIKSDLTKDKKYGSRTHLIGAGVSFHLDLSWHVYAVVSSGILDRFPGVRLVLGHMGEGIPFNLWRASHWINHPFKRDTRPCKHDYKYYFTHNVFVTTSGFFSTSALEFCISELGADRCLYSIDTPYEEVKEAQDWWKSVDIPGQVKELVGRTNAIRVFKLPLEE